MLATFSDGTQATFANDDLVDFGAPIVTKILRDEATNSNLARSADVVTVTLSATFPNSNLKVGQSIVIAGATPASFNGSFKIASVTSQTEFTYDQVGTTEGASVDGTSGGDYDTMSGWQTGEVGNLVTALNRHTLECYNDWASGLADSCTLNTWAVDATHYVTIKAAEGEKYNNVTDSGFRTNTNITMTVDIGYLRLADIGMIGGNTSLNLNYPSGTNAQVERCYFSGGPGSSGVVNFERYCVPDLFINNTARNTDAGGNALWVDHRNTSATALVANNTLIHGSAGEAFLVSGTDNQNYDFINNVMYSSGTAWNHAGDNFDGTVSNNATSDSTAPGTNPITNFDPTELHGYKPDSESVLKGAGLNLSYLFTTDITGKVRTGSWDIGAFIAYPLILTETSIIVPSRLLPRQGIDWGRKPVGKVEIDWSHPLSRGLVEVFLYQKTRNGEIGTKATGGTAQIEADYIEFNGSSNDAIYSDAETKNAYDSLTQFSIFADVEIDDTSADMRIVEKIQNTSYGWALFFDKAGPNGTEVFDLFVRSGNDTNWERGSPAVSHTAGRYRVCGTFDNSRSAGDKVKVWVDGVDESSSSITGSGTTHIGNNTEPLAIGVNSTTSGNRLDGRIRAVMSFNRTLSDAEARSLTQDPYQFLREVF